MNLNIKPNLKYDYFDNINCKELYLACIQATIMEDTKNLTEESPYSRDYIAGIVDGEGHLGINKITRTLPSGIKSTSYNTRLQIASKDNELIEPLLSLKGRYSVSDNKRWNKNASKTYIWEIGTKQTVPILKWVYPALKIHRKKLAAKLLLVNEFLKKKPSGNKVDITRIPKQEAIYRHIKLLNSGTVTPIKEEEVEINRCFYFIDSLLKDERRSFQYSNSTHRPMAEVELADAVIRIMDYAGRWGYDIGGAIEEKIEYNRNRADHKIENRLKEGGKKF